MARPYKVHTKRIDRIDLKRFQMAIAEAYSQRDYRFGISGPVIRIFGDNRISQVSVQEYLGNVNLLITDKNGVFLFHGHYCSSLGIERIAELYYETFSRLSLFIARKNKIQAVRDVFSGARIDNCETIEEKWALMVSNQRKALNNEIPLNPVYNGQS